MDRLTRLQTRLRRILRPSDFRNALPPAATRKLGDPFYRPWDDGTVLDLNLPVPPAERQAVGLRPTALTRSGHPAGLPALREAVAELVGNGVDADGGVLVTPGATGAFVAALDAVARPGRAVVLLAPCSPLFAVAAAARRLRVRWVPSWLDGGRLRYDFDALSRAMRGAALFAVADPGVPLGAQLADDDSERLRWAAERSDVLLYVDETFRRFAAPDAPRLAALAPHRTLTAGSVSVAYGLPGVRVGWLAGPGPLLRACGLAQSLATPVVPPLCQEVAWRAVMGDPPELDLTAARSHTAARLHALGLPAEDAGGGPFLLADVSASGLDGRAFASKLLADEGVRVGPGDLYGPGSERFVRLSAATEPGRLREGLLRLARFVGRGPVRPAPEAAPAAAEPEFSRV